MPLVLAFNTHANSGATITHGGVAHHFKLVAATHRIAEFMVGGVRYSAFAGGRLVRIDGLPLSIGYSRKAGGTDPCRILFDAPREVVIERDEYLAAQAQQQRAAS